MIGVGRAGMIGSIGRMRCGIMWGDCFRGAAEKRTMRWCARDLFWRGAEESRFLASLGMTRFETGARRVVDVALGGPDGADGNERLPVGQLREI